MNRLILAPEWAQKPLQKFGFNRYGQPRFRVVWGPSVTKMVGGWWADTETSGYRRLLKYGARPNWMLEIWKPCELTPEQWREQTATPDGFYAIGPYPAHGTYECAERMSQYQGYVPLEPGCIEMMARAVVNGRFETPGSIKQGLEAEVAQKERKADREFDDRWEDLQHAHKGGLTIGAHAKYNHQEEVDNYVRRLVKSKKAMNAARNFKPGFSQGGN